MHNSYIPAHEHGHPGSSRTNYQHRVDPQHPQHTDMAAEMHLDYEQRDFFMPGRAVPLWH